MRLTILAGTLLLGLSSLPAAASQIPSSALDGVTVSYAKWKGHKWRSHRGDRGLHLGWVRGRHRGWAKHRAHHRPHRRVYYRYY